MSALVCVLALRAVVNQLLQAWKRKKLPIWMICTELKKSDFLSPSPHLNNASWYILKNQNKAYSATIANSSIIVIDLGIHTILCYNVG